MKNIKTILLISVLAGVSNVFAQYTITNAFPNMSFSYMTDLMNAHDGTNRLFVCTQRGIIYVFPNSPTTSNPKVFLDLTDKVSQTGSETGLLSITFHPNYTSNRYFFVDYTTQSSPLTEIVSRFVTSSTNPDSALKSSELNIMSDPKPFGYTNHNGGKLNFGADGYLYISRGDGGSEGDPNHYGQDRTTIWAKMLRIDINTTSGGNNYSIPTSNPYYQNSQGWRQEILAYGLRNPWRFSFDSVNNKMWCGDVGQNLYEEIDIVQSGNNYGWSVMEGFHCYNPPSGCDSTGMTPPIWEYPHTGGNCSITGGYVYRGSSVPFLDGKYIYGDYCTGNIYVLTYDFINPATNQLIVQASFPVSTFGVDQNREIYICRYGFNASIYKFNPYPIGIQINSNQIPSKFNLYQNFPNPFNPTTEIKFDIPDFNNNSGGVNVKLEIFNYDGQLVSTPVNANLSTGSYSVNWVATNQPSGVYIYRIIFNGQEISKKMVLVK
jgi:glucose/arabinose dehydrogenase